MPEETGKQQYWRSLDELHGNPEFERWLHREFQEGPTELPPGTSRRQWFQFMAAAIGLAGATACRKPVENIMPHARGVEDYIPGKPYFYSTAMAISGVGNGLLVEVNDGRPTKVEGNPLHPFSLGAANGYQQASVLNLYDPDRQRQVLHDKSEVAWDDFFGAAKQELAGAGQGAGLRFVSERIASPSYLAVKDAALKKYPAAKWVEYEAVASDHDLAGAQLAFGQPVVPVYHFDKADVILTLDSDFLGCDAHTPLPQKQFAAKRRVASEKDEMNRLYAVESMFTVTGAMADHRLRARSADIRALAAQLGKQLGVLGNGLNVLPGNDAAQNKFLAAVAKDLQKNKGKSLVLVGARQPAEVHALAYAINQALGNMGETVTYAKLAAQAAFRPQVEALKELAGEMNGGQVQTLIVLGGNPVFSAPADLNFGDGMKKVKTTIHLTAEPNETSELASWVLPEAHFMEAWGDVQSPDGTAAIQQPLIQPLFNGKTAAEVVAILTGYPDQRAYDIVRTYWLAKFNKDEKQWRKAVHDGVIPNSQYVAATASPDAGRITAAYADRPVPQGIEVVFVPSSHTYDGRFANNGWLQEAPDPMTKLVWDNAALMSPKTAKQLGVQKSDIISIEHNGRKIEVPVMEQPGHADNSITLAVGHGRTVCGRIGKNVGSNVYPLRTTDAFAILPGVNIAKTGRMIDPPLATTQEHHSMEGRDIVREASLEQYKNPHEFKEMFGEEEPLFSLFQEHDYSRGNQWGMAIDLNTCIGCNACTIACQAENNIPIVGKEQVLKGREMHWLRMDRYYTKSEDDPQAVMQVMLCQQCENAPCEAVCPVAATAHSPEGLNDMAYNRCVGTRYCSNNCPYKVRRFNFFNWHEKEEEVQKMVFNPDVTVRMRGVMEKCNYCVQRIQEVKIQAKAENHRPIRDGEIQTACQQTCPTDSIVFGNIADPNSRVSQLKKQNRDYAVLRDLNVKPRTTYLTKLRNPNPELA